MDRRTGKRCIRIWMMTLILAAIIFCATFAFAEGYPESEHPYAENSDITWTYQHTEDAYALKLTFSEDTELESGYDFLYVTDEDGNERNFTGMTLQGKSIYVLGDSFTLRLTTDSSENENGFAITAVETASQEDYEEYMSTPQYTINSRGVITGYSGLVEKLVIPDTIDGVTVVGIGSRVFLGNTVLTEVTLPDSVTSISYDAFYGCSSLTDIHLSESLTSIGDEAFCNCSSLTELVIPDSVTSIGGYVFYGCSSLTELVIPDGVTSIGNAVFYGCSGLADIHLSESLTSIGNRAFRNCSSLTKLVIPDGVTSIGDAAFYGCSGLTDIHLSESLTSIGDEAFRNCSSLTELVISDGVTSIGGYVFYGCSSLTELVIPDGVTSIGGYVFYGCSSLTELVIPDSVTSIGNAAFYGCSGLTDIHLSESLTSIGEWIFNDCSSLTELVIPDGVTSISDVAFRNCSSLTKLVIPDSVTSIGCDAFYGCSGLTDIHLSESLTSIGEWAFRKCSNLPRIELPGTIVSIGENAFHHNTVLVFGSSSIIEEYALDNSLEYISNSKTVVSNEITDPDEKAAWVVATYTKTTMSEYEIALRLYDWLCANVQYDYQYYNDGKCDGEYSSELGVCGDAALIDGWAVCQGYAEAYQWLLEEAGIEAKLVNGYNHAWNIAKIDGKWYQFDATWDEAGDGEYHDHFALSDMAMRSEPKNHATQYTYRHLVCDSWEANYFYRNGDLDAALAVLTDTINKSISAGTYSGDITIAWSDSPDGRYSEYTIALILNQKTDWDVSGRVEIAPTSNIAYSFVFYPDEEVVTDILIEGFENPTDLGYLYMYPGYSAQMNVTTEPVGAPVTFSSSDESIITVSDTGLVTGVGTGTATIYLTSRNYSREVKLNCMDYDRLDFNFYVENDDSCYSMDLDETIQLKIGGDMAKLFLANFSVSWTSSDSSVATVDENGLVTPVSYGKTTITAVTDTDTCSRSICVRIPVDAVCLDQTLYECTAGDNLKFTAWCEGGDQTFYKTYYGNIYVDMILDYCWYGSLLDTAAWNETDSHWEYSDSLYIGTSVGTANLIAKAQDHSGMSTSAIVIVHSASPMTMPAGLTQIGEEAFCNTAAQEIIFAGNVKEIGSRAFADSSSLKLITIPSSVESIASDAFSGSENVTLLCTAGSYACEYAAANNLPYIIIQ